MKQVRTHSQLCRTSVLAYCAEGGRENSHADRAHDGLLLLRARLAYEFFTPTLYVSLSIQRTAALASIWSRLYGLCNSYAV